jgi:IPT/TIG domain
MPCVKFTPWHMDLRYNSFAQIPHQANLKIFGGNRMKFQTVLLASIAALFVSCAPNADRPSVLPVLVKLSEPAAVGQSLTIQGRYLGGPSNSSVTLGADDAGNGGVKNSSADIVSWTSSEIVLKVPSGARPGGHFVFVDVGGVRSNLLPYSVNP